MDRRPAVRQPKKRNEGFLWMQSSEVLGFGFRATVWGLGFKAEGFVFVA